MVIRINCTVPCFVHPSSRYCSSQWRSCAKIYIWQASSPKMKKKTKFLAKSVYKMVTPSLVSEIFLPTWQPQWTRQNRWWLFAKLTQSTPQLLRVFAPLLTIICNSGVSAPFTKAPVPINRTLFLTFCERIFSYFCAILFSINNWHVPIVPVNHERPWI